MVIVSDATAVTTLLKAGQEGLLHRLFGQVVVPAAVHAELRAFHPELPVFVVPQIVSDAGRRLPGTERLGPGEAEAIKLAKETRAELLLTDDRQARLAAERLGVRCLGLLGLLVRAKQAKVIRSVGEMVTVLETRGGLYLSDAVKAEALRSAGE
jgi:predicted nucleic acid-binding protein